MLKVQEALLELSQKTFGEIQRETAIKWASRAAAAFERTLDAQNACKHNHFSSANAYWSEALEHAAEVGPYFVQQILDAVSPYHDKADQLIQDIMEGEK
jgi:hypothetical protein